MTNSTERRLVMPVLLVLALAMVACARRGDNAPCYSSADRPAKPDGYMQVNHAVALQAFQQGNNQDAVAVAVLAIRRLSREEAIDFHEIQLLERLLSDVYERLGQARRAADCRRLADYHTELIKIRGPSLNKLDARGMPQPGESGN